MGATSIEWTDHSINPIRAWSEEDGKVGHWCEKVSPGCKNCYASRLQARFGTYPFEIIHKGKMTPFLDETKFREVLSRKLPTKFFWCDMSDMFGEWVHEGWINACVGILRCTPHHTHQLLTKRAERMKEYFSEIEPVPYIWLGFSAEDQPRFEERWAHMQKLALKGWLVWCSAEPLLGPLDISSALGSYDRAEADGDILEQARSLLKWVVTGGESGPNARPMHPAWARSIRDRCQAAGVPFFFKQWGEYRPIGRADIDSEDYCHSAVFTANEERTVRVWPDGTVDNGDEFPESRGAFFMERVGKHAAGRLLDGREWSEFPEVR